MTKKTNSTKTVAKKIKNKKAPKTPEVNKKTVELGNLCIHALALFTNAVIKKRFVDAVEMLIPLTIAIGKKTEDLEVSYIPVLSDKCWEGCKDMSLYDLGMALFINLCGVICKSDEIVGAVGKPLNTLKKFEIITTYKDKCVYKDGSLTFVKAR